ncbi:MAG: HD domain-containing protein [Gemmatimonadaceae bacterium]
MTLISGYSDRINHALAFAAKHHDQQVRRGTRSPYLTQPANVAIILTRYGCREDIVVAGILVEVVEDFVRGGFSSEMLDERISEKFGRRVTDLLLTIVPRRHDDDGIELSADERRGDVLERLQAAPDEARWVLSAVGLHGAASLLADLRRTVDPDSVWSRLVPGKDATLAWYDGIRTRLRALGFAEPIVDELSLSVDELQLVRQRQPAG